MHVPLMPYILGRDPPIQRHKTEYMSVPLGPTSRWGFSPILDWARGPAPGQVSFQTPRWVPGSLDGRASPSVGQLLVMVLMVVVPRALQMTLLEMMALLKLATIVVYL